jgi:hypothetical protein
MSFSYGNHADFARMGIPYAGSFPRQLGQPQEEVFPTTGSNTYQGWVTDAINHFRVAPYYKLSRIPCIPLGPGTSITVILDSRYLTWAYVQVQGGLRGWVGIQHVSSGPAHVLAPSPAYVVAHSFSFSFSAAALVPITYTYMAPSVQSPQFQYIMPSGSILIVIAVSSCGQWFQLHRSNTWIPASWVQ